MYEMKPIDSDKPNFVYLDIMIPWNDSWNDYDSVKVEFLYKNNEWITCEKSYNVHKKYHSDLFIDDELSRSGTVNIVAGYAEKCIVKHLLNEILGWKSYKQKKNISKFIPFKNIQSDNLNTMLLLEIKSLRNYKKIKNVFNFLLIVFISQTKNEIFPEFD